MNLIQLENYSLAFGDQPVLHSLTLALPHRGMVALTGPSGGGKSTLLRVLNGLVADMPEVHEEGSLLYNLDGTWKPRHQIPLPTLRATVGLVLQHPAPLPFSVEKNFTLPLTVLRGFSTSQARKQAHHCLEAVGLWEEVAHRLNDSALTLSGGQAQRLCIARALALEPQVLMLDEPTSSLDPKATERIEGVLRHLAERLTLLVVTHDRGQPQRLGALTYHLNNGTLQEVSP